jgi:phosphoglycolate phosphatase
VNKLKYNYVLWDFNGTIFDDVEIGIESINELLSRRNMPIIKNADEYRSSFMFPIIEWYKKLGFDFEREDYNDVAVEWVKEYLSREHKVGTVEGVTELLEYFNAKNVKQIIVSASETGMLRRQLSELGIIRYFEDIVGLDNIHAAGKTDIAVAWRQRHKDDMLLFIGDTDHDAEVAKVINADCILVAKGHQSFERLKKTAVNAEVLSSCGEIIYKLYK